MGESVNNIFSGQEYIQYKNFTFKNVTDMIQKLDPATVDRDHFVVREFTHESQAAHWKSSFSDFALNRNPVSGVKQEVDAKTKTAISDFFDRKISEEELSNTFQELVGQLADACEEAGYPIPLPLSYDMIQCLTETFYSEFRRKILEEAVQRNYDEGKQYIPGEMNAQRNWKYYNSDYYFKSEAAISALTDGLNELAQGPAYEGFTLPDYKAEVLNLYYNFNTAFSNRFDVSEQFLLDPDMVPPEHFQWFYQSGGDGHTGIKGTGLYIEHPDGREEFIDYTTPGFDPNDFTKATTWACYQDFQGNEHFSSADFTYNFSKSDLRNVAALLNFTNGDPGQDAAVNRFLGNLQVYSEGYFLRFRQNSFDCSSGFPPNCAKRTLFQGEQSPFSSS